MREERIVTIKAVSDGGAEGVWVGRVVCGVNTFTAKKHCRRYLFLFYAPYSTAPTAIFTILEFVVKPRVVPFCHCRYKVFFCLNCIVNSVLGIFRALSTVVNGFDEVLYKYLLMRRRKK
jgi:hypothetical protein